MNIRRNLTDSTALLIASTPAGAFLENVLSGMSDEASLKSRAIVAGLYYVGLGGALGYGRDLSRNLCHITDKTQEKYQHLHDMTYISAATLIVNPLIYLGAGARDEKEIITATLWATLSALCMGGTMGYITDVFRDLTGYKASARTPRLLQHARPKVKKLAATSIVIASFGIAGLIYTLTPDEQLPSPPQESVSPYKP